MSLQVWLPLNGDLRNQGVSNAVIIDHGATVNASGKIGSCYSFDGSSYLSFNKQIFDTNTFSVSFWIKANNISGNKGIINCRNASNKSFAIYLIGAQIRIDTGSNWSTGYSLTASTWTHITFTTDGTTERLYVNGIQLKNRSYTSVISTITNFCTIGCEHTNGSNLGVYFNGYLNDIRIYNHCLSAAEVKEISQGLVLHYKLDKIPTTITNAYNMTSWDTNATRGGFSAWGPSGHSGTSGNNTDRNYIYRSDRTYSYYISENAGTGKHYIFYQSPAFEGGYRSLSAIIKEQNSIPIDENVCTPGWNANVTGSNHAPVKVWTRKISLGNGFYLCQVDGFYQSGSNDLVSITVLPGYKIYISEIWLEDNKQISSDVLFPSEQVEDSSGYNHNGTILNTILLSNDTPRYSASTNLTAGNSAINCGKGGKVTDSITVNLWLKASAWANPISCTESGGWNFESNGDSFSFTVYISGVGYKHGVSSTTRAQICNNQWHMLTGIYDRLNGHIKIYVDGELDSDFDTDTTNTIGYNKNNVIWLGAEASSSATAFASNGMTGLFSDFRIYATALSADDILQLYHTSAKVDNLQNLHTFELVENNLKTEINKRGQLICNGLNEDTATKFYKSGNLIETNEIIEL